LEQNVRARVDLTQRRGLGLPEYLGLAACLVALQAVVTLVAGTIVLSAGHALYSVVAPLLLCAYGMGLLASALLRDILYAFGWPGRASSGDPVGAVLLLAMVIGLAFTRSSVTLILLSFVVSTALEVAYLLWVTARSGLLKRPVRAEQQWRAHLRKSLPALLQTSAQAAIIRGDRLVLGVMAGTAAVGIYGVAATMTEVLWLVPLSLGNALFHRIAGGTLSPREQRRIRAGNLLIAALSTAALALIGPTVIVVVFGSEFSRAATPLRILCVAAVLGSSYHVDIVRLTAAGALRTAGRVVGFSLLITALADVVLVATLGINGAALASVIGYATLALGSATAARAVATARVISSDSSAVNGFNGARGHHPPVPFPLPSSSDLHGRAGNRVH
jgi:O-antigen/teichoic acid export membrane protein